MSGELDPAVSGKSNRSESERVVDDRPETPYDSTTEARRNSHIASTYGCAKARGCIIFSFPIRTALFGVRLLSDVRPVVCDERSQRRGRRRMSKTFGL